jgi:hypothetical protein
MHVETKLTLIGAGSVLLLDTIFSLASVYLHLPYVWCFPATCAVYFWASYRAAKHLDLRSILAFGAFLGLVDATIGWRLSDWLGPDPNHRLQTITFSTWCMTAVFVMAFGAVVALAAFFTASWRNRRESR